MIAVTLTDWEGTMVYHTAVTFPRQTECPGSVAHGSDRWVSLSWESSVVPGGAVGAQDQTPQEPHSIRDTEDRFLCHSYLPCFNQIFLPLEPF